METLTANQQEHHVMGGCGEDTTVDSNLRSPRYPTCSGHYHQGKSKFWACADINATVACKLRIGLLMLK